MDARAELAKTLAEYGKDFQELINIKPKQFEIASVAHMVTSLPPRKWKAAQARVDATIAKKDAQQKLKALKASRMLAARNDSSLKAEKDRTAWVDNQSDVQQAEIDLINADAEETAAELAYECLDDLFTAGKKIMDYLIDQDKATRAFEKYDNDARRNT